MTGEQIVQRFSKYEINQGSEVLLDMRRDLSCFLSNMANDIMALEKEYRSLQAEVKLKYALKKNLYSGTVVQKEAHARSETYQDRKRVAELDGEIRGFRIKYESYESVIDSMASYLKILGAV